MRVAGVKTIEQANEYLTDSYLVWWNRELTVEAGNSDDAHRALEKRHHLAASLRYVETRQIRNDYTFRWEGKLYQIERAAIRTGFRGADVRVEKRLDGTVAARYQQQYLGFSQCAAPEKTKVVAATKPVSKRSSQQRGSDWKENFDLHKAPKSLAGGAEVGLSDARSAVMGSPEPQVSQWHRGKARPVPGNPPHDRPVSRGDCLVTGGFVTIPPVPLLFFYRDASVCVFEA
jgi:hypothetical protein